MAKTRQRSVMAANDERLEKRPLSSDEPANNENEDIDVDATGTAGEVDVAAIAAAADGDDGVEHTDSEEEAAAARALAASAPRRPPTREELEDPLALYARQLAAAPAMTPDEERTAAAAIVEMDIAVWARLLAEPRLARAAIAAIKPAIEKAPKELVALDRALAGVRGGRAAAGKSERTPLVRAIARVTPVLRAIDPDRQLLALAHAAVQALPGTRSTGSSQTRALGTIAHARRVADAARAEFVRRNLRLVMSIARRYKVRGMPLLDLVQEGNLGLIKAMDRFDPSRGFRFSTYAVWWIRHHINRAVADKSRLVRVPVHRLDRHSEIERTRRELAGALGREATQEEVAKAVGLEPEQLERIASLRWERVVSLDAPAGDGEDDNRSRHDWFQDPHSGDASPLEGITFAQDVGRLRAALTHLKPIEVTVLEKRFGMGGRDEQTLADIGVEHGLSRERIRQIEQQALVRLRKVMEAA